MAAANEIAFAAEEMTEPHGNTPSWQRFADIQGKTITKVTLHAGDQDDISIETDLYCKEFLKKNIPLQQMRVLLIRKMALQSTSHIQHRMTAIIV